MIVLDRQLKPFETQLVRDVGLSAEEAPKVATLCAADVRFLPVEAKRQIIEASEIPVSARYEELLAFQLWSDLIRKSAKPPPVVRAQVIVQNYVCFLYLKDACFEAIAKHAAEASVVARCARYLCRGAVRDFRNAFAHANWCYNTDFTGLKCWVNRNAFKPQEGRREFEVSQSEIDFWQTLSRAVAYSAFEQLKSNYALERTDGRGFDVS
jgi:hypothetical protein